MIGDFPTTIAPHNDRAAISRSAKMGTQMSGFDWRSENAYDRAQNAEITGFAWECLRRTPDFQRDNRGLTPTSAVTAEFRQRWGLTFRS